MKTKKMAFIKKINNILNNLFNLQSAWRPEYT